MNVKLRLMRVLVWLGGAMLVLAPSTALAHDKLGGDELAATGWMFIAAVVVIVMGLAAGLWAFKSGQFNNIEESKYRMIEISEDYDAVMAEVDERVRAAAADAEEAARKRPQAESAVAANKGTGKLPADRAAQAKP